MAMCPGKMGLCLFTVSAWITLLSYGTLFAETTREGVIRESPNSGCDNIDFYSIGTEFIDLPVGRFTYYLEENDRQFSPEDVLSGKLNSRFKRCSTTIPHLGINDNSYWFMIGVKNSTGRDEECVLELGDIYDSAMLYVTRRIPGRRIEYTVLQSRFSGNIDDAYIPHRHVIFKIPIENEGERVLYLHFRKDSYQRFTNFFFTIRGFLQRERVIQFKYGIYYGILISLLLYNFFLFLTVRDISYLYYILFLISFGFAQSTFPKTLAEYLWINNLWWLKHSMHFFSSWAMLFGAAFTRSFLNTRRYLPTDDLYLRVLMAVSGTMIVASLVMDYSFLTRYNFYLYTTGVSSFIVIGIRSRIRGFKPATYYVLAWSFFIGGIILSALVIRVWRTYSGDLYLRYISHIGSAAEMILLSLALGDRIRRLRDEREKERKDALEHKILYNESQIHFHRMELELLKKSIQPHFLMNSLTALRSWLMEKPATAITLLDALTSEIRPLIDWTDEKLIPLEKEIELCRAHCTVMGMRLERDYNLDTRGITGDEMVPPLMFHTLVENTFSHNNPDSFSKFVLEKETADDIVKYSFTVMGLKHINFPLTEGTGMKYIRSRLEESFPRRWDLAYGLSEDGWRTTIRIQIDGHEDTHR